MRFTIALMAFIGGMFFMVTPSRGADAPFVGKFSNGNLVIELTLAAKGYGGTITLHNKQYPVVGQISGKELDGAFSVGADSFPFSATLDADTLTLSTGGKAFALKRVVAAVNPLAQEDTVAAKPAPANPLAESATWPAQPAGTPAPAPMPDPTVKPAAAASVAAAPAPAAAPAAGTAGSGALANYTVEVSTDSGKSLVAEKPNVATVQAALMATLPDLAAYFGQRPAIGSAYQDAKDASTGGATFSSSLDGHAVRGIISVKLENGGAKVAIVFGRADAPKGEWEKLMSAPAPQAAAGGATTQGSDAAVADVPLTEHDYGDGTGSVGLASGWTTQAQSALDATVITGPGGLSLVLHNSATVFTPDSQAVRMRQNMLAQQAQMQANMNARRVVAGLPPPPHFAMPPLPPMLVGPFTDPTTALQNMVPEFSKRSEFNKGPSFTLNKIISSEDLPCQMPNGKRARITYSMTRTMNGQSSVYEVQLCLVTVQFQANGMWMWLAPYSFQAPEATFDKDLPIAMAMVNSEKVDKDKYIQVSQQRNQQMYQAGQQMIAANEAQGQAMNNMYKQTMDTQQKIHDEQQAQTQAGYDAHNAQFKDYELQRSRNAADFNESIIGTRTVYDTVTGQSGYANLTDVNGVVDSLNQAALDPNRFIQIPLRDQLYPIPPAK